MIDGWITAAHLRGRGWSRSMIEKLLGEPDRRERNPVNPVGPGLRLYSMDRVVAVERTDCFKKSKAAAKGRSAAARAGIARRRKKLRRDAEEMRIDVKRIDIDGLERLALAAHNALQRRLARRHPHIDDVSATTDSSARERQAIVRRYIRNRLVAYRHVNYDRALERTATRAGAPDVVDTIRRKVDAAIDRTYPELAGR